MHWTLEGLHCTPFPKGVNHSASQLGSFQVMAHDVELSQARLRNYTKPFSDRFSCMFSLAACNPFGSSGSSHVCNIMQTTVCLRVCQQNSPSLLLLYMS